MSIDKARAVFGGQQIYTEDTENEKSPTIEGSRDGTRSITRVLILHAPEDIETLFEECLPSFRPPGKHPSNLPFFAERISIKPLGKARAGYAQSGSTNLGYALHDKYRATITYTGLNYDPNEQTGDDPPQPNPEQNMTLSIDTTGQYEVVPSGSLYWEDGTKIDDSIAAGVVLVSDTRYSLTKFRRAYNQIPFQAAEDMIGRVNVTQYDANHFAFPSCKAQTLLFTGMRLEVSVDTLGARQYNYTLDFWKRHKIVKGQATVGWNHFYDPNTKEYRLAYLEPQANVGNLIYKTFTNEDLKALLTPP